ncbi:hypothetical protein ACJMK2_020858 [Sinanodonta woodiana]|uniref:TIR domain-containing protein n=1 Tax=Sinanodonta woodiana TaxID=1069815 RepID=A0ABD3U3U0_SINWO
MFELYGEIIALSLFTLAYMVYANSVCPTACECNMDDKTVNLSCNHTIPNTLPLSTRVVNITDIEYENLTQTHFNHVQWASVTKLYLVGGCVRSIFENTFWNVRNLTHLQISFRCLFNLSPYAFSQLTNLRTLDLSGNLNLSFYEVANALNITEFITNLEELNLQYLSSLRKQEELNATSFPLFQRFSIKRLDLSHSNVRHVESIALSLLGPSLEELRMIEVDLTFVFRSDKLFVQAMYPHLQICDISNSTTDLDISKSVRDTVSYYDCVFPLFQASVLRMNYINSETVITQENVTYKSVNCNRDIKVRFELKYNKFRVLDIKFDPKMPMYREVDLSNNGLEYLSLNLTSHFTILNWVSLSQNNLSAMDNHTEFVDLFAHNLELEYIDLSFNTLYRLPRDFFLNNKKLKTIIISNNLLTSELFRIEHLNKLECFDISNNNILFVDYMFLRTFENMRFETVLNNSHIRQFAIKLTGNIFKCECDTKSFIQWILTTRVKLVHRESYMCEMHKNVTKINDNTLRDIEQNCDTTNIILLVTEISVFSAGILLILSIILICMYRRSLKLRHIKFLIQKYRKEDPPNKHLVFLSFCNSDRDFVYRYIIDELKNTLSTRLNASKDDIVCIGDIHFEPGRYILDEIIRCTESCCVVLLVVSEAFCKSDYCDFEAICAQLEKKPIILMFLEDVDPKCMSKMMYKHFQRYTRVRWVRHGDEFELVPSWGKVCDSICSFAGANARLANTDGIVEITPLATI